MAINKKLITFDKKLTFLGANGINNLSSPVDGYYNLIPTWSMVFIKDTGEIWHDGIYFGKPIKDQILPVMQGTTKGLVFTPNGTDYYYKTFNLWGNTFDGDTININGDLVVQGVTYKWTYGDAGIKKGNTNLIAFSNNANNYDVFIPNGDLNVTGGDIDINNNKIKLSSTGSIKGTHILNTNSYFNADNTLGKTWNSIKLFSTSGTTISLDTTKPAIINILEHAHASNTLWVPWIAGGDITEQSSWGIGLGGDAFYIGRIAKTHTENSLSNYWKFSSTGGLCLYGTTKYITAEGLENSSTKVFMADGTVKTISDLVGQGIEEASTTTYGGFKLTYAKANSLQALSSNTNGDGRYAIKMNANGTLYVDITQANTWTAFVGATVNSNGTAGYVPAPGLGNQGLFFRGDGTWATPTDTWIAWVGATDQANGTAGYMPAPTSAQKDLFLKGDGTWVALNNYSLPVATSAALGGVKVGTTLENETGYIAVHIKNDVIYYKDTTYSFFNLLFLQTSGTNLMTYDSQAARTILAGDNITFTHNNNILTIKATDTTYSAATDSTLGLVKIGTTLDNVTGYTKLHIKDGIAYYHDTTYSFYKLKFLLTAGTDLMTYDSLAVRTIVAGDNITFTHSNNVLTIKATNNTYSNFTAATAQAAGKAGLVPGPSANQLGSGGYYLKADGTWDIPTNTWKEVSTSQEGYVPKIITTGSLVSSDNPFILVYKNVSGTTKSVWVPLPANAFNNTWTAADFTNAGYVPKSVKGKFLHAKSDTGALEWVDDNNTWNAANTSQAGYIPKLATGGGTIASADTAYVLVYKSGVNGATTPVWMQLPANAYNNTWTANAVGVAGYVAAPTKANNANMVWKTNSEGVPAWRADSNDNSWRGIYVGGTSKVGTGTGTLPINFVSGSNITITYEAAGTGSGQSGNAGYFNVKIAATNTWNAMTGATSSANGTVGYINAAPPKDGYNTKFWRADGTWAVPSDNNTQYYLTLNGTVKGTSGKTDLGTIYAPTSSGTGFLKCSVNGSTVTWSYDNTTYATPDTTTTLSRASGNLTKDTWTDVGTFADSVAEGTWVVSFTADGSIYSGIFSRKKSDTMSEEIDLHAAGTSTKRIYARTTGNKFLIVTADDTFNPGAITFNFRKLL